MKKFTWGKRVANEARIQRIKQEIPITDLLAKLDAVPGGKMKNGHPTYHCPLHDDNDPSLCVSKDDRTWTCWPCDLKRRDAITLVQMMLFPGDDNGLPSGWFAKTLDYIEDLFGLVPNGSAGSDIRMAVEYQEYRNRHFSLTAQSRVARRVLGRSNRFRLNLRKIVRRAWGDDLVSHADHIVALYGHLDYLIASGQAVDDNDDYKEWHSKLDGWLEDVKQRMCRRG